VTRLTRRRAVAASVAALAGASGCGRLEPDGGRTGTEITAAFVSNNYPEPRTVSVVFERSGDVAYWRQFSLPAHAPDADTGTRTAIPVDSLTDEPVVWTVRAFNHQTERHASATFGADVDPESMVDVEVSSDDRLVIWNGTE